MHNDWFYGSTQKDGDGPYTDAEIRKLAAEGRISRSTLLWRGSHPARVSPAGSFPSLKPYIAGHEDDDAATPPTPNTHRKSIFGRLLEASEAATSVTAALPNSLRKLTLDLPWSIPAAVLPITAKTITPAGPAAQADCRSITNSLAEDLKHIDDATSPKSQITSVEATDQYTDHWKYLTTPAGGCLGCLQGIIASVFLSAFLVIMAYLLANRTKNLFPEGQADSFGEADGRARARANKLYPDNDLLRDHARKRLGGVIRAKADMHPDPQQVIDSYLSAYRKGYDTHLPAQRGEQQGAGK